MQTLVRTCGCLVDQVPDGLGSVGAVVVDESLLVEVGAVVKEVQNLSRCGIDIIHAEAGVLIAWRARTWDVGWDAGLRAGLPGLLKHIKLLLR